MDNWEYQNYNSGFSVDDWVRMLNDSTLFETKHLEIMKRLKNCPEEAASCTQLSYKYGETKNFYNSNSSTLAEKIQKLKNCPIPGGVGAKWLPILYWVKPTEDGAEGSYYWKLRPELSEALNRIDLSNIKLSSHARLHDYLESVLNRKPNYYKEAFSENAYANQLRKASSEFSKAWYLDSEEMDITGSPGQGGWSTDKAMWIGLRDKKRTINYMSGVYIVYLISKDASSIYLTLNQGSTDLVNRNNRLVSERERIRAEIKLNPSLGFVEDNDFTLGYGENDYYVEGCIYYKRYDRGAIPNDEVLNRDLRVLVEAYESFLNNRKYSWIDYYQKLANRLMDFKDDNGRLLEKLKAVFKDISQDKKIPRIEEPEGTETEIDPFTVYAMFDSQSRKRPSIMIALAKSLNLDADFAFDYDGVPSANPQHVAYFSFRSSRGQNDIVNLWRLCEAALNYADNGIGREEFISLFDLALAINQVGVVSLTQALFRIRPYCFLNTDDPNRKLILSPRSSFPEIITRDFIDFSNKPSGEKYCALCDEMKEYLNNANLEFKDFPGLSSAAWTIEAPSIWKISYGTESEGNVAFELRDSLEGQKLVAIDPESEKKQLKVFNKEIKTGDYFYLCYGKDKVRLLGMITGEAEPYEIEDHQLLVRSYSIVSDKPVKETEYAGKKADWLPSNSKKVCEVDNNKYEKFENELLKPYFDLTVKELIDTTPEDLMPKHEQKYWVFRHSGTNLENPFEQFGKQHSFAYSQYEVGVQVRTAKKNLNQLIEVQEGDILFFTGENQDIYAYGRVIKPRAKADLIVDRNQVFDITHENYPGRVIQFKGLPFYNDYKNNPLNDDEAWGQRIDVDCWINNGPSEHIPSNYVFDLKPARPGICIDEISEKMGKKLIKALGGSTMDAFEYSQVLEKVHNIVLTGAPGTGKTYLAMEIAKKITTDDDKHIVKVQFHHR